jgi:TetR/AcrR family transcriptional regulator, transcriptional repressor of bet genes
MATRRPRVVARSAEPARKARFTRQLPEDRRQALIECTIESLKEHGYEGLSVRRIAARAGVSVGLINHHFPSIDQLIAESYRHFSRQLISSIEDAVAQTEDSPRGRLRAFLKASFSPPTLDADVLTVWVVFWSLYRHSEEIQSVHRETYGGYVELVQTLLSELARESGKLQKNQRLAAIGLIAMMDGLWLEWCLDPGNFSPKEAVTLCESWIACTHAPVA